MPPCLPPTDSVNSLVELWDRSGGDAHWKHRDNWLQGEPCVDAWFGVLCCPDTHRTLRLQEGCTRSFANASSADICRNDAGDVVPQASGEQCKGATSTDPASCLVVGLQLANNGLDGTLGESLGRGLDSLQMLCLQDNALRGGLPNSLATSNSLRTLSLGGNAFNYDASYASLETLVQRCKDGAFSCSGLPPASCDAFGYGYMVRTRDPDTCEVCNNLTLSVLLLIFGAIGAVCGISLYVYMINKSTNLRKMVSTIGIVLNHMQTIAILGLLKMHWPRSVVVTTSFFTVDFFAWEGSRPECLASGVDMESVGGITVLFTAGHVALLLVLLHGVSVIQKLVKFVGRRRGWQPQKTARAVDRLEMVETIVFHVQLTAGLRLTVKLIDAMFIGGMFPIVGGAFGWMLFTTQIFFIAKYFASARMLALRSSEEQDERQNALAHAEIQVEEREDSGSEGRAVSRLRGLFSFGAQHKSRERLQRRMNYLVRRYGSHAWYWQFVLWTRQLLLTAVVVFPELAHNIKLRKGEATVEISASNGTLTGEPLVDMEVAVLQAILALLIFITFFILHRRIEPFIYRFQNKLDGTLFVADMLIVFFGLLYTASGASKLVELLILLLIIGSVVVTMCYLVYRHVRAKRRKQREGRLAGAVAGKFRATDNDEPLPPGCETAIVPFVRNDEDAFGRLSARQSRLLRGDSSAIPPPSRRFVSIRPGGRAKLDPVKHLSLHPGAEAATRKPEKRTSLARPNGLALLKESEMMEPNTKMHSNQV